MPDRILPFIETDNVFDPKALHAMGEAFDRVRAIAASNATPKVIAAIIIEKARSGERDADKLVELACAELELHHVA